MITSKQSKAARALLGWSLDDLAKHSSIAKNAIANFEKNLTSPRQSSLKALHKAFLNHNIEFIGTTGVKEKEDTVELFFGQDSMQQLWDNILLTLGEEGGEVLITNVDEKRAIESIDGDLYQHIEKMKKSNITERLLSCEGDNFFLMPRECYKWIPKDVFSMSTSTYIYADKLAYQLWGDQVIILVHSERANQAERKRFEYIWDKAITPPTKSIRMAKTA